MGREPLNFGPEPAIRREAVSGARYYFYNSMYTLFWHTLCPRPDGKFLKLRGWLYNATGRIASYFHKKICLRCRER
jgi:hypothetical protein